MSSSPAPGWRGAALRTNLFYAGTATPNLGLDIALGQHTSLGVTAGLKPWPRWLAWDYDVQNPTKWRHLLVAPEFRWWPKQTYDGWFLGVDLLYAHYNLGAITLPFGLYPTLNEHRLQGDAYGAGLFFGHSWWLGEHWRLELAGGAAAVKMDADVYQCAHCGQQVGAERGIVILPQVALNIAWDTRRRTVKRQQILDIIAPPKDTLRPPVRVQAPEPMELESYKVKEWEGVAGELKLKHPVLRPSSEYKPYTPDRILRKEEGALYVFFELDKSELKRSFTESSGDRDNGPVLDEIMEITTSILKDTTSSVSCIQIIGLASIDGAVWHNENLSWDRAKELQAYIQDRLSIPDSLFEAIGGGEAWSELRDAVNDLVLAGGGAGLTTAQLQQVLDIIDGEPDPDRREYRIKALDGGAVYQQLKRHVLAEQRNSGYLRVYYDAVPDENARLINSAIDAIETGDMARAREIAATVQDDPRASAVLDCLQAYERHQQQEAAYQKYLQELEEYNKLFTNQ